MDTQMMLNFLFGSVSAILGWFARELWSVVKTLKDDLHKLREEIAQERVHKDDFKESVSEIKTDMRENFREVKEMLGSVFARLESKADK